MLSELAQKPEYGRSGPPQQCERTDVQTGLNMNERTTGNETTTPVASTGKLRACRGSQIVRELASSVRLFEV